MLDMLDFEATELRVVVVGAGGECLHELIADDDKGVGKSSLTIRFLTSCFVDE